MITANNVAGVCGSFLGICVGLFGLAVWIFKVIRAATPQDKPPRVMLITVVIWTAGAALSLYANLVALPR